MDHWMEPTFEESLKGGVKEAANAHHIEWFLTLGAFAAFAIGTGAAYWVYIKEKGEPAKKAAEAYPPLYRLVLDKWRIDELYGATVLNGVDALGDTAASVDQSVVDGILARLTALLVAAFGTILRALQTGVVHVYAAVMVVGVTAMGWFFVVPHADATVTQTDAGSFEIAAAPGPGYTYRWYPNVVGSEKGKALNEEFTSDAKRPFQLEPDKKQTIRLEVRNAFGFTSGREFQLERPKKAEIVGDNR
jgi:NADH-quinone oxidoreductase subunit L